MTEEAFRAILDSAEPISPGDPSIPNWHYAPWYVVEFELDHSHYEVLLFLDGQRGLMTLPNQNSGYFSYSFPTKLMAPNKSFRRPAQEKPEK